MNFFRRCHRVIFSQRWRSKLWAWRPTARCVPAAVRGPTNLAGDFGEVFRCRVRFHDLNAWNMARLKRHSSVRIQVCVTHGIQHQKASKKIRWRWFDDQNVQKVLLEFNQTFRRFLSWLLGQIRKSFDLAKTSCEGIFSLPKTHTFDLLGSLDLLKSPQKIWSGKNYNHFFQCFSFEKNWCQKKLIRRNLIDNLTTSNDLKDGGLAFNFCGPKSLMKPPVSRPRVGHSCPFFKGFIGIGMWGLTIN